MVPWTQLREPCLRRMWTDLISELTYFNPVIRLSKVKPSAFPFYTFLQRLAAPAVLLGALGTYISSCLQPCRTIRNLLVLLMPKLLQQHKA